MNPQEKIHDKEKFKTYQRKISKEKSKKVDN